MTAAFLNGNYLNVEYFKRPFPLSSLFAGQVRTMKQARKDSVARIVAEWRRERPELDPSPVEIQGRVMRLAGHFQRRIDARLAELGLTWEAFSLIVTLRRRGKPYELRPTDLLQESLLTSGAITNRIDKVERMGLVQRTHGTSDRRSTTIRLTPAGRKLADKAIAAHFDNMQSILADLSASNRSRLAELLSILLAAFETHATNGRASGSRSMSRENARRRPRKSWDGANLR
jgi:DNA-binding MarR family transcriptional regulator